jgi:hypothetical protein
VTKITPLRRRNLGFEPIDGLGLVCVIVLVIERQIVYPDCLKRKIFGREPLQRTGQLLVVGFAPQAPDHQCDLTHEIPLPPLIIFQT